MTVDIELLNQESIFKSVYPIKVVLPNGDVSKVTHTRSSDISNISSLKNGFHIQFKYNLLSISKVARQL